MDATMTPTVPAPSNTTTAITSPVQAQLKNKRKRRAPPSGAAEDCHTCRSNGRVCDRRRPYCTQCIDLGGTCAGYRTQLTWGVGVASRGKLRGLSLPIPLTEEEKEKRKAAQPSPAQKKEAKKNLRIATAAANAGIHKAQAQASSVAAAASLASLRNMNYDFVNNMENISLQMSGQRTPGHKMMQYNSSQLVTSNPQFQQFSPSLTASQQYQKLMHAVSPPQQSGLSLLLSPMSEFSAGQTAYYHADGSSTPEIYSPLYSPAGMSRAGSDDGYLDSPYHSRNNSGDYDYLQYTHPQRPHPQSIPTSVPGHVAELFEDELSIGQSSPSIYGRHDDLASEVGTDGGLSALLYEDEINNAQLYANSHNPNHYHNASCSPNTCISSPGASPSPPPLVHSASNVSGSYYYAYSPPSPTDINTPPPTAMSHSHSKSIQMHLAQSYPPTPSSMSPSTPTTPLHCHQTPPPMSIPTSSPGSNMPLTSPALMLQQQLIQNQNALAHHHRQQSQNYLIPSGMSHEQQYFLSQMS